MRYKKIENEILEGAGFKRQGKVYEHQERRVRLEKVTSAEDHFSQEKPRYEVTWTFTGGTEQTISVGNLGAAVYQSGSRLNVQKR